MAATFFHKPELALRRALELEGIKQDDAALSLLHEVLSSRRHRTWSPAFEQIMIAYLDLCLKLSKAREAKDGLHQYRNLSQSQAPGSLEKVIRYLIEKAENKCTEAKAFVDAESLAQAHEDDDEDGFSASPQAILLSTMSTDPAKSQRDSALLLPALKFLWETYRAVLDILRSNSKLEHVYHAAAQGALRFCRTYKRRMEFRHLCDMLRTHLGNLRQYGNFSEGDDVKSSSKVRGWDGWSSDSVELHLQTRFAQLETASILHRYTEGFRTVEDIYNILQISHQRRKTDPDAPPPKAKLMATYYEKLTTLFWVSENYLFHAFAWYKYYTLCKEYNRSMSDEMKLRQASAVLLATLCIPPGSNSSAKESRQHGIGTTHEDDIVKQRNARMATLLGFHTRNPTREALLTEIRSKDILEEVPQYLRELYVLFEENADPLIMVEKARPLLDQLKQEVGSTTQTEENDDVEDTTLGRYVSPLTYVLLLKLTVNLSTTYHTVSLDYLKKLTSGLGMSFEQVEKSIVQFTQNKTLSVRIDHRSGCLRFGDSQLESDDMRSQLAVLAKQLEAVSRILKPIDNSQRMEQRTKLYQEIRANTGAEYAAIVDRKNLIEKRKEEIERLHQEKAREEQRIKAEEEAARKAEEEKRIAREQRLREQEKQRKIQLELENQEKKRFLAAMGKNTEDISEEQMALIDTQALQREHQEKINRKREEAERKMREEAKKLDYLVRAIRIEELPLIKKRYEEKTKLDRERHEEETKLKLEKARTKWEADIKDKELLERHSVFQYFSTFEEKVMADRKVKHEALCREAEAKAEVEAEKAKLARARKRKNDEEKRIAAEEARRQREEELAKEEEEKRKREEARKEREAKEEERRQAELKRMEDERKKKEADAPLRKYVPPSARNKDAESSNDRPSRPGNAYPGGGRYLGSNRPGESRMGENWRSRDRSSGDREGGDRGSYGDRTGDRGNAGDRRGFGSSSRSGGGPPQSNSRWR